MSRAPGASLVAKAVRKSYGPVLALRDVSLEIEPGEILTLLGPSGSGKTTLLKCVAGFETAESGQISLGGLDITDSPPAKREIGMLFQNYALFPHLTVAQNIAFPLQMRNRPKREIQERVAEALKMVELSGYEGRLPKQLSGGQQQRVALARAVVFNPRLLLLDEPFGALDRKLRESMQLELRHLQRKLGLTTLFVTHDQEEALILSDRIAVMNEGRIEQVGLPNEIYRQPRNWFVADFIGESNLLRATLGEAKAACHQVRLDTGESILAALDPAFSLGQRVGLVIRPERVQVGAVQSDVENVFEGAVTEIVYVGQSYKLRVRLSSGLEVYGRVGDMDESPALGEVVSVGWKAADARLIGLPSPAQ